jgi:RND family efflux transporter MFP subunit
VRLGVASTQTVQDQWEVVGRLQQVRQSVVASEVSGKVIEMAVDAGDRVEAGRSVLARIDDVWAQIGLRSAEAELAAAQADEREAAARLVKSRIELEKYKDLFKTGVAKPREYDEAQAVADADQARVGAATARIAAAAASLERAQREIERLVIYAPFDGVVVQKMIEVGEWAQPGAAIAQMVSRGPIDAVIDVPERLVNNVVLHADIDIRVEALNREVQGKVIAIVPQGSNAARTFPVRIRLDDEGGQLMSGMSIVARVPTTEKIAAMTVPRDAVVQTLQGAVVWAALDGKAAAIPVQVMFGQGDRYVVRNGPNSPIALADNMNVIVEGGERLFPGRPLAIVESGATHK